MREILRNIIRLGTFTANAQVPKCVTEEETIHHVPEKEATKLLAITFSNRNRFSKFFHCSIEDEYLQRKCVNFPPHLKYVLALPWES